MCNALLAVLEAEGLVIGRPEVPVRNFLVFCYPAFRHVSQSLTLFSRLLSRFIKAHCNPQHNKKPGIIPISAVQPS